MRRRKPIITAILATIATGWVTGCDAEFVQREAQRALATFLNGIVTTAINESIAPED